MSDADKDWVEVAIFPMVLGISVGGLIGGICYIYGSVQEYLELENAGVLPDCVIALKSGLLSIMTGLAAFILGQKLSYESTIRRNKEKKQE